MKAISIKQPWAIRLAHGLKDIENLYESVRRNKSSEK